jgi:GT2 family glycosyltransferase
MYCEDLDLSRRFHQVGKTMYYPAISIVHNHEKGSYKSKKLMMCHIQSVFKYFNKWGWIFDKGRKNANDRIKF